MKHNWSGEQEKPYRLICEVMHEGSNDRDDDDNDCMIYGWWIQMMTFELLKLKI